MSLVNRVLGFITGQQQLEQLKLSSDQMFEKWEKHLMQSPWSSRDIVPVTKAKTEREQQIEIGLQIDFGIDFGDLSDERLDSLAETFIRFEIGTRHRINFTVFVKAVISGRWKEYIGTFDEPASTIEKQYKIKHRYRSEEVMQRQAIRWPRLLPVAFLALILGILFFINPF